MLLFFVQLGVSIFGCLAFLLVTQESARLQKAGTLLGVVSVPFWIATAVLTQQWFTLPVHLVYAAGWLAKAWWLWKVTA